MYTTNVLPGRILKKYSYKALLNPQTCLKKYIFYIDIKFDRIIQLDHLNI
jgi:hypothetical protein